MIKCPNKNLPEWKELEKIVPDVAYTVWDMNNGHGIDKAPNGEPSILFQNLLEQFNGNREEAILQKVKIFSNNFINNANNIPKDQNGEPFVQDVVSYSTVQYNKEDFTIPSNEDIKTLNDVNKLYEKIQKGLKDRLNTVKRYSNKNPKLLGKLQDLIQQLSTSETEQGIVQFIEHVSESISDSKKFLERPINEINARQIRQLSNDYIGFYKPLLDGIQYVIDTTDMFKDLDDYNALKSSILDLTSEFSIINNRFINILKRKGYDNLTEYLTQQGMPESMIQQTINWLDDPKHDSSIFMNWFGMATNSDNAVQQAIAKMLNDTKNATDRETLDVGIRLTKLLNKVKSKYGNDVQKLMYEKYDDGTYTGNRVKPLNWGQHKRNQKLFLEKLANKLGIEKDANEQYILPQDENIQQKWFDEINKWYGENSNRKYKQEYYDLRNKMLSLKTKDAINEIQNAISNIETYITTDGVTYDNLLSDAEYNQLQELRKQKKLLANPYNLDGSVKTGDDAIIAKELSDFNEQAQLNIQYISDKKRYENDLNKVIAKYGGNADHPQVKLWQKRNTTEKYTQEFYDRLEALKEFSITQSAEYEQLRQKRAKLYNILKDPITNKVDPSTLSDSQKKDLLQLDRDLEDLKQYFPIEKDPNADSFSSFAEIALVDQYYKDAEQARNAGTDAYNKWYNDNHYEDMRGNMQPAYYYTELRPLEALKDKYTEVVPSGKYTTIDPESNWYNDKWDPKGPNVQPNNKYNNVKAYNAVIDKPELAELYNELENTMKLANSWISFMQFADDSRMPQIPARFLQALSRKDGIMSKLGYVFEDVATTKADDLDFVEEFSTMPNGDPIKVIPTRFIKMLDDTNTISTDATASVIQYFNMAANYKNMSEKQDEIELMLNLLKQISIRTKKELKAPGSTNVYKQSQLLVDRLMYGRNKSPILYNVAGKEINVGKTLDIVRGFITKVNLSGNLWSIGTGFFTDATYTTIEAKMGKYFDLEDLRFAQSEFSRHLPNMMANIGNPQPKGKVPYLLMLNSVVKDNQELFDRLDQSQVLRSINQNFWFAGYTQADYTVKSHTLISVYHNHRFVEGEGFLSKTQYIDKYYPNDRKKGAVMFKQLKTTLYDAYKQLDNGDTVIDTKYKDYVTEQLLNNVKNRIQILSKRIDGTIREVDKSGIHANSLASYLVMHRNFMVSAFQDRFKRKQYNLDMQAMEEGYYRSTSRFLKNIIGDRHFALKQMIADYNNMEEYEQYAVRRVLNELALVAGSTTVAVVLASMVDGDDDYDNWISQATTYLALRSAFEFRTMYNPFELVSLVKSPTAAFNWFDNASSFLNLMNPFSYTGDRTPFTIIDRGVYKGMPVIMRNIIKVTPFKSIFEAQDPKVKRDYLQNQLMNF